MITTVLFDVDGVLLIGEHWSKDLPRTYGITGEMMAPFFQGPFQACLLGKADLKDELARYLPRWGWSQPVEAFIDYWFQRHTIDKELLQYIQQLRQSGLECYLATQQERYRMDYILHTPGLASLFDGAFCSAHLGYLKTNPRFFRAILRELVEKRPAQVLFWDDSAANVATASSVGIQAEVYRDFADFSLRMRKYIK